MSAVESDFKTKKKKRKHSQASAISLEEVARPSAVPANVPEVSQHAR